jgi:hypothetical protein
VPSTVIFWTELSAADTKATQTRLRCSWIEVIVTRIMRSSVVTKYRYLKWQWIFYVLRRCFLSSAIAKTLTIQTTAGKNEPYIAFMWKSQRTAQHGTKNVKTHKIWATRTPPIKLAKDKQYLLLIRHPRATNIYSQVQLKSLQWQRKENGSFLPAVVCMMTRVVLCCLCLFAHSDAHHFLSSYVFMFQVLCWDARNDFRIKWMFGLSLLDTTIRK